MPQTPINELISVSLNISEKDLIEYSENLFDDVILNETINRTDFDININTEISILKNDDEDKNDKSKFEIRQKRYSLVINLYIH